MRAQFAAVPDVTVTGPTMIRLLCLCVVDSDGAIWSPCPGIEDAHADAVRLARLGMTAAGRLAPLLDAMRAHVAAGHPAAAAEQAALL